jgi:dihydroorotase
LLTIQPAAIIKSDRGSLSVGAPADVVVFDPQREWVVDAMQFRSKSRNTPFAGWKMRGQVVWTVVNGKVAHGNA